MPRGKSPETEAEGEREGEEVGLVSPAHAAADREGGSAMRCVAFAHEDPLLALTLLGVVVGLVFGLLLTAVLPGAEDTTGTRKTIVKLVSFPGKMFLNLLKMMVVPSHAAAAAHALCSFHHSPRVRQLSDSRCSAAQRGSTAPGRHGHQTNYQISELIQE